MGEKGRRGIGGKKGSGREEEMRGVRGDQSEASADDSLCKTRGEELASGVRMAGRHAEEVEHWA